MRHVVPYVILVASLALLSTAADADKKKPGGTGTVITIDPNKDCEKEKVQKCHWEGDRHVCVWVDGPNCRIY